MVRALNIASIALLVTGCTIHPLPEDVTGVSTFNIVKQIRLRLTQLLFIRQRLASSRIFLRITTCIRIKSDGRRSTRMENTTAVDEPVC
jgi:hypothetical protein